MSAITYAGVSFAYPDRAQRALDDVELAVEAGDVLLVVGGSGSGKSTLLRAANGLVPHATGGRFAGEVAAFGRSTRSHRPRELADVVGFVHQDPEAQLVVDHVEADVAFVLENLGVPQDAMRRRVEEVLDALGIAHLRNRAPSTLSGGERQRVAIAGALAAAPSALVLDEPTSQLDPQGADDVLAAVARLNTDLGTTVVVAEHRLERAAPIAHHVVQLDSGRVDRTGTPAAVLADYPGAPTVTLLGRLLGWDPVPLTVRDARRLAASSRLLGADAPALDRSVPGEAIVEGRDLVLALGGRAVLAEISVTVARGEVVALLGRNGAGKTTLLRALGGLLAPSRGSVVRAGRVGSVPQDPNTLLTAPTVRGELEETLRLLGRTDATAVEVWLERLHLDALSARNPRDLSGGERQRLAIGAVAVADPDLLLLDEPTRGMDWLSREALVHAVGEHAGEGGAVVLATHDVELAARVATRAIVLGDGDIVADGPARDVLAGSLFAPQVLRVLPPFLTIAEIEQVVAAS